MKVKVTYKDLADGVPSDAASCPIAHSIKRALGLDVGANVTIGPKAFSVNGKTYATTLAMKEFIAKFDAGTPVAPQEFDIPINELPRWVPYSRRTASPDTVLRELDELANSINRCLVWNATPQGYNYWKKIHDELQALARELVGVESSR